MTRPVVRAVRALVLLCMLVGGRLLAQPNTEIRSTAKPAIDAPGQGETARPSDSTTKWTLNFEGRAAKPSAGSHHLPHFVSAQVPEGNYLVTVEFSSAAHAAMATIKAESRRLMIEPSANSSADSAERWFVVNVRTPALIPPEKHAPGGTKVVLHEREWGSNTWDDKLNLEIHAAADGLKRVTIEPIDVPTVYLAGDSTVTDQRFEDGASWGQMLPRFFGPTVAIANHAESGETLKSFSSGLRLAKMLERMRPGDWLFIQFGHNDQKVQWAQTHAEAGTTYNAWLKVFIAEARRRGATPVLVTSPQRRMFDAQGRVRNTHGDYPAAVRKVAAEEAVALIDLDRMSVDLYEALGPERSRLLFADNGRDATHHNNFGGYELARCVVQAIRRAPLPLSAHLVPDLPEFDPAHPDDPASFRLPASPRN